MSSYLNKGWRLALRHLPIAIALFLYRLLWGFFLYRLADSIYPSAPSALSRIRRAAPWSERAILGGIPVPPGQDRCRRALYLASGKPVAGPYDDHSSCQCRPDIIPSIIHRLAAEKAARTSWRASARVWKPVMAIYWTQALLALAPLALIVPKVMHASGNASSFTDIILSALPWVGGWLLWLGLLHVLSLALQYGAVSGLGISQSIARAFKRLLAPCGHQPAAVLLGGILGAGISLPPILGRSDCAILQQAYPMVRTLLDLWMLASQYNCWEAPQQNRYRQFPQIQSFWSARRGAFFVFIDFWSTVMPGSLNHENY